MQREGNLYLELYKSLCVIMESVQNKMGSLDIRCGYITFSKLMHSLIYPGLLCSSTTKSPRKEKEAL